MPSPSIVPLQRRISCTFGPFAPVLRFSGPDTLEIAIGGVVQEVTVGPVMLRGGPVMLSWTERDGTVVVHVHDYEAKTVHSHARLPDGSLVQFAGILLVESEDE